MAASRTAGFVALYRALEERERGRARLFADPFAAAFLPLRYRLLLGAARVPKVHGWLCRYADRRAPGARTSAVARTRFLDDLVKRYVAEGIRQVVVLGAGFDSRANRLAELSASVVFEVDRPDTQRAKQTVLGRRPPVARVRYVPADLLADDLGEALGDAGWDAAMETVFLWEGVTNYLTADAVASVLAWIGAVPGRAVLAFTYVHAGLLDGSVRFDGGTQMLENVRALGEPWTFGLRPTEVGAFLERCGLALSEELGADEYRARYLPAEPDGWRGYAFYRLAVATNRIRAEGKGIPA